MTDYSFVLNAVIAILLPAICARHTSEAKMPKLVFLRKTSIVIYFTLRARHGVPHLVHQASDALRIWCAGVPGGFRLGIHDSLCSRAAERQV